jgi:hypothetical protein
VVAGIVPSSAQIQPFVTPIFQGRISSPWDTIAARKSTGSLCLIKEGGEVKDLAIVES